MRMWDYLDKYIRVATWPSQTKIPSSAPVYIYIYIYAERERERERERQSFYKLLKTIGIKLEKDQTLFLPMKHINFFF